MSAELSISALRVNPPTWIKKAKPILTSGGYEKALARGIIKINDDTTAVWTDTGEPVRLGRKKVKFGK